MHILNLADALGHGSHRTEGTPSSGFVKNHFDKSDQRRGQHQTIKSKAKLRDPIRNHSCCIDPPPRNTDRPKQFDRFPKCIGTTRNQPGLDLETTFQLHYSVNHSEFKQKLSVKRYPPITLKQFYATRSDLLPKPHIMFHEEHRRLIREQEFFNLHP